MVNENNVKIGVEPEDKHFDVHLDIPKEQFEELRAGRKVLVVADPQSGEKISVSHESNRVTWKQAGAVLSILVAIGAQMVVFGRKMEELDTTIKNIGRLQNDVTRSLLVLGQHGEQFAVLRDDMNKMLALYTQVTVELKDRTNERYRSSEASKDWRSHEKEHNAEQKLLAAELDHISRLLEKHNAKQFNSN